MHSKRRLELIANSLSLTFLLIVGAWVLLPIWWIFRSSLMTNAQLYAYPPAFFPQDWLFSNYPKTMEDFPFWDYLANTLTIIIPSVIGGTVTATMGGYAFARLRFRFKRPLFCCVSVPLLLADHGYPCSSSIHHVDTDAATCMTRIFPWSFRTSAEEGNSTFSLSGSSSNPFRGNWMTRQPSMGLLR
jgi:hypothetical protein